MISKTVSLKKDIFIFVLLALVLLNGLLWAFSIPFNGAPDEYDHYRLAKFISQNNRIPVLRKDMDFYFMSLYTKMPVADWEIVLHKTNPIFKNSFLYEFKPLYMMWPCGAYLFYGLFGKLGALCPPVGDFYFMRLFSVLCGGLIVFFIYDLARKIFPKEEYLPKLSAVFAALIPQFTFLSGYINPDIVTALFVTLLLLSWDYCVTKDFNLKSGFFLGVSLGFCLLGKISGYGVILLTFVFLLISFRNSQVKKVPFCLIVFSGVFLISGWFFIRNFVLYGDVSGYFANMKAMTHFFRETPSFILQHDIFTALRNMHYGIKAVPYLFNFCFTSFWGVFGWMNLLLPKGFYFLAYGLTLIGFVGWIVAFAKNRGEVVRNKMLVLLFCTFPLQIFMVVCYVLMIKYQPQGRYFHAILAPLSILLSYGWLSFSKNKFHQRMIFISLSFVFVGLNILAFFYCRILGYFQPLF